MTAAAFDAFALAALLALPGVAAITAHDAQPATSAAWAWEAVDRIEDETARLASLRPDLFPESPSSPWRTALAHAPALAAKDAAIQLGEVRMRMALQVPQGAETVPTPAGGLQAWLATYYGGLLDSARERAGELANQSYPASGPGLEDWVEAAWPTYHLLGTAAQGSGVFGQGGAGLEAASTLLPMLASLEAQRVLAQHFVPPPPASGLARLAVADATALFLRGSFDPTSPSAYTKPAVQGALAAQAGHDAFGTLMHTLLAEYGAEYKRLVDSRFVPALDVAPDLEAAKGPLAALPGPPSLMEDHVAHLIHAVLQAAEGQPLVRNPGSYLGMEALGRLAALRLLRGADTAEPSPGLEADAAHWAAALATVAAAAHLARRRKGA